jgi:hypothetical protein
MKIKEMNPEQKRAYYKVNKTAEYARKASNDSDYDKYMKRLEVQQDKAEALGVYN